MAKYDDAPLIAAIEAHEASSEAHGNLSEDRTEALERYLGEPMGNEIEGRSQVVSRDTWDTIEWIKPQLADIFCGGDEVVSFSPRGPEDEKGAEQETDYVNYLITQRNNWFEIWNNWSHDALLQKNGYVLCYWDDSEDRTKERYVLTDDEMVALLDDDSVKLVEYDKEETYGGIFPIVRHHVVFERAKPAEVTRIVNVPPENVRVSKNHRALSLQDPRLDFCEHFEKKTISELRAEGFDVDDDISDSGDGTTTFEAALRDRDNPLRDSDDVDQDPSMRRVLVRHVWIRHDCDDDGRAELRDVIIVGKNILQNEETDLVTLVAMCPYILPHQHTGLSVFDAVRDLEEIKTALLRGGLDAQYLANNGRYAIGDGVNLDDMLDSRPGGVVRVSGADPAGAIFPLTHPNDGKGAVAMIEYMDHVMQRRTGVNEQSQGLDQNTLNKTFGGAQLLLTAAQQRIKFIARVLAETGVKPLFQVVHAVTLHNSRKEAIAKLRGSWVPVDPRQWFKRSDMQISVALGAGDKPQQMAFLEQTFQKQMAVMPGGLANPQKVYATLARMSRVAGYKNPEEFWVDPSKAPPQQKGPPPEVQKVMAEGQVKKELLAMKGQQDMALQQGATQQAIQEATIDGQVQRANKQDELAVQAQNDERDAQRQMLEAHLQRQSQASEQQFEMMMARFQQAQDQWEANLDARVKMTIAGMSQQTAMHSAEQRSQHGNDHAGQ